jgi:uncharacterized protein
MELQETLGEGPRIQAYENGTFVVDLQEYHGSILVEAEGVVRAWRPQRVDEIGEKDILELLSFNSDVILLGTGEKQAFIEPKILAALYDANIGVEMMNTTAACRTYNLLMAEGRQVLAALIV